MIQTVIDTKYKGVAIGVYLFCTTISGTVAAAVVGNLISHIVGDKEDPDNMEGKIIALNTMIPCLLAAICFYIAGFPYQKFKNE